jgi:hypothetical protein
MGCVLVLIVMDVQSGEMMNVSELAERLLAT